MKIVKAFEDYDFYTRVYEGANPQTDMWSWGLGDDGNLYYQCTEDMKWYPFNSPSNGFVAIRLSIKDMKRIVKEFGHLLVFI